jgi:hypothetical protein
MRLALILLTLADLALLGLLVAVSGFVLEGVNNTGPMMPQAVGYVAFMVACIVAPAVAWWSRTRWQPATTLLVAASPLLVAAMALLVQPA